VKPLIDFNFGIITHIEQLIADAIASMLIFELDRSVNLKYANYG